MSKKEKNMNNVEEKDIKKADNEAADTTTDANAANTDNKDADAVETQLIRRRCEGGCTVFQRK